MPEQQSSGASPAPKNIWGIVIVIIITAIVVGGGVYWWQQTETDENTNTVVVTPTNKAKTTDEIKTEFQNAINDKNYEAIGNYLARTVNFIIDRSECCGDISGVEAFNNIESRVESVISYNFWQDQQIVKSMKVNLADTFADMTVGVAETGEIIAYSLDAQNKVNKLFFTHQEFLDLE